MCMASNALEKSTNNTVVLSFFLHEVLLRFDGLSESEMLWIGFSKNHLILSKNFLNSMLLNNRALLMSTTMEVRVTLR